MNMSNEKEKRYFLKLAQETNKQDILTILAGIVAIRMNDVGPINISIIDELKYKLQEAIDKLEQKQEILRSFTETFLEAIENPDLEKKDIFDLINVTNTNEIEDIFSFVDELIEFRQSSVMHNDSIDKLMVSLADIDKTDSILDPSTNSSRFWQLVLKKNLSQKIYLQGTSTLLDQITALKVIFYNAENVHIYSGDVLENPKYIENDSLKTFDKVITIPPFGQKIRGTAIEENNYNRYRYGEVPKLRADYAYISNAIASLNRNGKAVIILPIGDLSRGRLEANIRKRLVDLDLIEAVIKLPSIMFQRTAMSICVLVVNKNKEDRQGKIIFINADQDSWKKGNDRLTILDDDMIKNINEIYHKFEETDGISTLVENNQIIKNNGDLTVENYVYPSKIIYDGSMYKIDWQKLENSNVYQLKDVVNFVRGVNFTSKQEEKNGEVKVIKINNIQNNQIQFDQLNSVSSSAVKLSSLLKKDDILISIRGSLGKVVLFDKKYDNYDYVVNGNMVAMRVKDANQILPKWILLFLRSALGQIMLQQSNSGSLISSLSLKSLGKLRIPVIALEKQREIIEQYELEQEKILKQEHKIQEEKLVLKYQLYQKMGLENFIKKI